MFYQGGTGIYLNRLESEVTEIQITRRLPFLGDRHARYEGERDELVRSFHAIQNATRQSLRFIIAAGTSTEKQAALLTSINQFIEAVFWHTVLGWQRAIIYAQQSIRAASTTSRTDRPSDPQQLQHLKASYGLDDSTRFRAVVAAADSVGKRLRTVPQALTTDDLREVLLPEQFTADRIEQAASSQCVVGPVMPLSRISESAQLARRGADALRAGAAADSRQSVPYEDLTGVIVIDVNSPAVDELIREYLSPLLSMRPHRRVDTGQFLLEWLLRGVSLAQLARDLQIPKQTAHYRVQTLRDLFGEDLEDPRHRFELIIALRCALPRWQEEGSTSQDRVPVGIGAGE